jgi:octaprenyl-diphosphate synthase
MSQDQGRTRKAFATETIMLAQETRKADTAADISPVEKLQALVADDMRAADSLIHDRLGSAVTLIPDLAQHLIDSGGKRLRPLLTLAAAKMGGYDGKAHAHLAAAVEFIHTATLLHDDVVDESALRRGKVSANIVWGNKPSVLVGDFLLSRAFRLMVETGRLEVLDVLAGASAVIAEGEVLQMKAAGNLATLEAHYMEVIGAKTAALFAAAAEAGAMLADVSPGYRRAMRDFGQNLGIAFQLVDDALDYSGRQALMGKTVGDDFREGKVTLPVILAVERADAAAKKFWTRAIETGQQSERDLDRAITLVEQTGAISDTVARARDYAARARASLNAVPACEMREVLAGVADFCVERAY